MSIEQRYKDAAIFIFISSKEDEEEAMSTMRRKHNYRCWRVILDVGSSEVKERLRQLGEASIVEIMSNAPYKDGPCKREPYTETDVDFPLLRWSSRP